MCFIASLTLAACNFNVTPTFYVRDIQDVVADKQPIEIPIFLKLPASDVDSCNSEVGQVLGILRNYGMNGTLQSCSLDDDNFFALANVEFSASVVYSQTSQAQAFDGIIGLIVEEGDDPSITSIFFMALRDSTKSSTARMRLPASMASKLAINNPYSLPKG